MEHTALFEINKFVVHYWHTRHDICVYMVNALGKAVYTNTKYRRK